MAKKNLYEKIFTHRTTENIFFLNSSEYLYIQKFFLITDHTEKIIQGTIIIMKKKIK